jgi:hypothetical protein
MVRRRVQTQLERKRTGPEEWLVVTRRPLTDDWTWASRASRDATEQDERYHYHYYLTPTAGCAGAFTEPSLGELARVIKEGGYRKNHTPPNYVVEDGTTQQQSRGRRISHTLQPP